jgi:hypothetical protein
MINARKELQEQLVSIPAKLECADITREIYDFVKKQYVEIDIRLPVGYSEEEFTAFLTALNFDYDDGYGTQELYGTIWFDDGTWLERYEYDGSEWWVFKQYPVIPEYLSPEKCELDENFQQGLVDNFKQFIKG